MTDATWTILVVDDEAMLRSVFRRWLAAAGYNVLEAASAREALVHLGVHRETISAVLTDLRMPGMSGMELIERLRTTSPFMPVIAISGNEERPPGISPERFLEKPVAKDVVLRAIVAAVEAVPRT